MAIPEVTPDQAKARLDSRQGYVYLDVRTVPEFNNGRPPGALNIPVAEPNPALGQMELNPRFMALVEATIPKDARVLVGCKTGGRSAKATEMMLEAGYKDVASVDGGFMGITDETGHVVKEGWSTLGYPVERGEAGDRGYAAISRGAAGK